MQSVLKNPFGLHLMTKVQISMHICLLLERHDKQRDKFKHSGILFFNNNNKRCIHSIIQSLLLFFK